MNSVSVLNENLELDLKTAVKRGANWLDENHAGWARWINLSELDLNNCENCIIGQSVGNFDQTVGMAGGDGWAETHGFEVRHTIKDGRLDWEKLNKDYEELEVLWTKEVKNRVK